ncbi:unnamed protein product, partial [Allacma fusca]
MEKFSFNCYRFSFRTFLIISAFLGLFPVQNPFRKLHEIKFSFLSIFLVISLATFIYSGAVITEISTHQASLVGTNITLSQKIINYSAITSTYIALFIVRLASFLYCQQTLDMIQMLYAIKVKVKAARINKFIPKENIPALRWFLGASIIGASTVTGLNLYTSISIFQTPVEFLFGLKSLPKQAFLARILFAAVDLLTNQSLTFAFIFVMFAGTALVQAQNGVASILEAGFQPYSHTSASYNEEAGKSPFPIIVETSGGHKEQMELALEEWGFQELFLYLKRTFEIYSAVGGWYMLALLFYAVMDIVKAFSSLTFPDVSLSRNLISILEGFALVLVFAMFGEFIESEIEGSKERILNAVGRLGISKE